MIKSELNEASENSNVNFNRDTLTGTAKADFYDVKLEWEIQRGDQAYKLVERSYITRTWLYLFYSIAVLTAAGIFVSVATSFYLPEPGIGPGTTSSRFLHDYLGTFLLFSAAAGYIFLLLGSFSCPSLVTQIRGITEGHERNGPLQNSASLLVFPIALGLAGFILGLSLLTVLSSVAFLVFCAYTASPNTFVTFLKRTSLLRGPEKPSDTEQESTDNQQGRDGIGITVPVVVGEYLIVIAGIIVIPLVFLYISTRYGGFALATIGMAIPVAVLLQMMLIFSMSSGESALAAYMDVKEGNRKEDRNHTQALWLIGAVLLTLIAIGITIKIVDVYQNILLNPLDFLPILIIPISVVVPVLYVFAGLGYQAVHSPKFFFNLFRNSEPFPEDIEAGDNVHLLTIPDGSPTCLKIAGRKYIFLPRYLNTSEDENLSRDELEAVIAHEQYHLQNGDATLYLVVPVLSLLLLTGQNVIFGLLNFRQREHQADEYAANSTNPSTLETALKKTRRLQRNSSGNTPDSNSIGFWQNYFSLFYGTFAQSQAHPTIEERIEHIENTQT